VKIATVEALAQKGKLWGVECKLKHSLFNIGQTEAKFQTAAPRRPPCRANGPVTCSFEREVGPPSNYLGGSCWGSSASKTRCGMQRGRQWGKWGTKSSARGLHTRHCVIDKSRLYELSLNMHVYHWGGYEPSVPEGGGKRRVSKNSRHVC